MSSPQSPVVFSVAVTRTYAAAHTLRSPQLSADENERVFGKCAHPHGHGHDYRLRFVVSAERLCEDVVIPRGDLEQEIDAHVSPLFAGQDLNASFDDSMITSGENLTKAAWSALAPHLPKHVSLQVHLHETRKNAFTYPVN